MTRRDAGAFGGRSRSARKLAALRVIHARRRGRRVHTPGMAAGDLARLMARVAAIIRERPERGRTSVRALADYIGVSDRTVRRWIDGVDWPRAGPVRSIMRWIQTRSR